MFVQPDMPGVGFAGAVVGLSRQRGAGPRGGCRGGQVRGWGWTGDGHIH